MKLIDLYEATKPNKKGTYAAVKFNKGTRDDIKKYIEEHDIPNHTKYEKMHTTLLYSRKYCPDYKPDGKLDKALIGKPTKFDVWDAQPDDDGHVARCLVLCYNCPELSKRHEFLMDEHDATYDYDDYNPHITFSYDIGDMKIKDLPKYSGRVEIIEEYGEDLNFDWAKDNSDISEKKDK